MTFLLFLTTAVFAVAAKVLEIKNLRLEETLERRERRINQLTNDLKVDKRFR